MSTELIVIPSSSPGPWNKIGTWCDRRWRIVGRCICGEHTYDIVQYENRESCTGYNGDPYEQDSLYESRLFVGNFVTSADEADIFSGGTPSHSLVCANCWSDTRVDIPDYMRGRYFSRIHSLAPCTVCAHQFAVADDDGCRSRSRTRPTALLFSTTLSSSAVEQSLLKYGIAVGAFYRSATLQLTTLQQQEIVAAAMHPKYVERVLESGGFDALEMMYSY